MAPPLAELGDLRMQPSLPSGMAPATVPFSPSPLPPRRRFGASAAAATGLMITGLVLTAIVAATAWWHMEGGMDVSMDLPPSLPFTMQMDLAADLLPGQVCMNMQITSSGFLGPLPGQQGCYPNSMLTGSMAIPGVPPGAAQALNETLATISNAGLLALLALIFSILALAFLFVGLAFPKARALPLAFGLVAGILLLVAPLYLYAAFPAASNRYSSTPVMGFPSTEPMTFFGSSSGTIPGGTFGFTGSYQFSWGAGLAWYLGLVGGPLLLAGAILAFKAGKAAATLGPIRLGQTVVLASPYAPPAGQPPYLGPQLAPSSMGAAVGLPAFCPSCGAATVPGMLFCSNCGKPYRA